MFTTTAFRLRSFVCRNGRMTSIKKDAMSDLWPIWSVPLSKLPLDLIHVFGRSAPTVLEIGFGTGQSLIAAALQNPDTNFLAVETHKPGIASLLLRIAAAKVTNIRIFYADINDVLPIIPRTSLASIQIFFPDPWPKRRHHARRLIQSSFIQQLLPILIQAGSIHLATDWQDYADHMKKVLDSEITLKCVTINRSSYRPLVSKFEQRALQEGRSIWDLQYKRS